MLLTLIKSEVTHIRFQSSLALRYNCNGKHSVHRILKFSTHFTADSWFILKARLSHYSLHELGNTLAVC